MTKRLLITASLGVMLAACGEAKNAADQGADAVSSTVSTVTQTAVPDGFTLVESVGTSGDDIVIPYNKYVLDNGLTVVLHKDTSDPLVHVDVTYHVGSGREDVGKSGFAHFFEHMMFQGSENVADEQHFKLISESGGTLNGTTNSDRTNYFETVPSNQLEKMLWLEADRMGYLLNAVTEEKFEVQRETVKNERGQRVDNQPYGLLGERVGEAMFPEGHPYSWSVIGYLEDLDRANLDDLKKFFLQWYGPNNAVITVGGDLDETQTLEWVKKYFGSIPRGPEVADPVPTPVSLDENRYISLEDNVQLPLLFMSWPTVHANHPDEAPLDVLQSIMGGGETSILYKNLQKPGLALQANAGHGCRELSCSFTLLSLANPGRVQKLADVEKIMRDSFVEFEERGVQDDDLARVKASIVSRMVYGLESVSGKVSQLAAYETFRNSPNGIGHDINRFQSVTKADVVRVYNKYIKNKPAVIMSIVPKGKPEMITQADTWDRYERTIPASEPANFEWSLPEDNFDRSVIPPSGANPSIKAPDVYRATMSNGINVLGAINQETPTTTIQIRMKMGQANEPLDKLGLAQLTASMVQEGTTESTPEEISNRLAKLGSSVNGGAGDEFSNITIRTLTENAEATMDIATEILFKPRFLQEDFDRVKANAIQGIRAAKKQPTGVATNAFNQILFGKDNAFSYPNAGTEETVSSITLDDVKVFYADHFSASVAQVIAVSNMSAGDMEKLLKPLSEWEAKPVAPVNYKPFPEVAKNTLYFIDKPGAAQSEIRIGKRALPYDSTGEYYKAGLMNFTLGGAFNSRINLNLREDKGYSYGARSFFSGNENRGFFRASAGVRTDSTAASITEFMKEIDGYHASGLSADELSFTKNAIGQSDARSYETPFQKLGFLSQIQTYDLDPAFVDEQNVILANMSSTELNALAKKHLNSDEMVMLVVGDKSVVLDEVKELGYTIVELDEDGNPL